MLYIKISLSEIDSFVEFIGYEKLKEPTAKKIDGEKGVEW